MIIEDSGLALGDEDTLADGDAEIEAEGDDEGLLLGDELGELEVDDDGLLLGDDDTEALGDWLGLDDSLADGDDD